MSFRLAIVFWQSVSGSHASRHFPGAPTCRMRDDPTSSRNLNGCSPGICSRVTPLISEGMSEPRRTVSLVWSRRVRMLSIAFSMSDISHAAALPIAISLLDNRNILVFLSLIRYPSSCSVIVILKVLFVGMDRASLICF